MNTTKVDLGNKIEKLHLYPLSDAHFGSSHANMARFVRFIEEIAKDEYAVVALNGDLINNALKNSVSDIYDEVAPPPEQISFLVEALTPIKNKIVSVTTGNHERRTQKQTGIDITLYICQLLGIEDKYHPDGNLVFLSWGKSRGRKDVRNTMSFYQTPGSGGGRTMGGKVNKVERLAQIVVADLYIHSHTHTPFAFKKDIFVTNNSNKGVGRRTMTFINTNAYEDFGGYGEAHSYPPPTIEEVRVEITADKKGEKIVKATV